MPQTACIESLFRHEQASISGNVVGVDLVRFATTAHSFNFSLVDGAHPHVAHRGVFGYVSSIVSHRSL